jgi:hypothetical protein
MPDLFLEPESLRDEIRAEADAVLAKYAKAIEEKKPQTVNSEQR